MIAKQEPSHTRARDLAPTKGPNPRGWTQWADAKPNHVSSDPVCFRRLQIVLGVVALAWVGCVGTLMLRPVAAPETAAALPPLASAVPPLTQDGSNSPSQTIESAPRSASEPAPFNSDLWQEASRETVAPPASTTTPAVPNVLPPPARKAARRDEAAPLPPPRPLEFGPTVWSATGYDRWTAVYDISAHSVYLPDGTRLEAHSGLGNRLDDPRYVDEHDRGATPPHLYDLTLERGTLSWGSGAATLTRRPGRCLRPDRTAGAPLHARSEWRFQWMRFFQGLQRLLACLSERRGQAPGCRRAVDSRTSPRRTSRKSAPWSRARRLVDRLQPVPADARQHAGVDVEEIACSLSRPSTTASPIQGNVIRFLIESRTTSASIRPRLPSSASPAAASAGFRARPRRRRNRGPGAAAHRLSPAPLRTGRAPARPGEPPSALSRQTPTPRSSQEAASGAKVGRAPPHCAPRARRNCAKHRLRIDAESEQAITIVSGLCPRCASAS